MTNTAAHLYRVIQDQQTGRLINGATVTVCNPGTSSPISAPLYQDVEMSQELSNPFVCSSGTIDLYIAEPQTVLLRVVYGSSTDVIDNLPILPPVEMIPLAGEPFSITNAPSSGKVLTGIDTTSAAFVDAGVDSLDFNAKLIAWCLSGAMAFSSITRNSDGAMTAATITWPDGTPGTYVASIVSSTFPGRVDSYVVTWTSLVQTITLTQPPVTRDSSGFVSIVPPMTIS